MICLFQGNITIEYYPVGHIPKRLENCLKRKNNNVFTNYSFKEKREAARLVQLLLHTYILYHLFLRVGLAWFFTSEQKMITAQMIDSELSHREQADDNAKKYLQIQAVYWNVSNILFVDEIALRRGR